MVGVDYRTTSLHNRRGVPIEKVMHREKEETVNYPCHLQQHYGRISMTHNTCNSLKANSFKGSDFMDPKSTLNTRQDFRVDPKKVRQAKTQKFTEGG